MDVMALRRELMMQKKDLLPAEYQKVEWVNGNSCNIDLNYVPHIEPKVVTLMAITSVGDRDVMGFPLNGTPSFIINPYIDNGFGTKWYNRYGSTTAYNFGYAFNYTSMTISNPPVLFEFGKVAKVNGQTYTTLSDADWSTNMQSFHLFGARSNHTGVKFYKFELWDGGSLIRNLIPCYRKIDNVIGLYDTVSRTFFTSNAGIMTIPN